MLTSIAKAFKLQLYAPEDLPMLGEELKAMAEGGWLGIAMPEEVGGSGLGLKEASIMMQTVARSGAGFTGCSSIHLNIFGAKPIEKFGTSEQKQEFLPKIISNLRCISSLRIKCAPIWSN